MNIDQPRSLVYITIYLFDCIFFSFKIADKVRSKAKVQEVRRLLLMQDFLTKPNMRCYFSRGMCGSLFSYRLLVL